MKMKFNKISFLLLIFSFFFFSCNEKKSDRIELDTNWKYSLENPDIYEVELKNLNGFELKNLHNFLPTREGNIYLTRTFMLPPSLQKEDISCYLGRIAYSDRTYLNHYLIGSTGYNESFRYSAGNEPRFYEIPEELLLPGLNTITIEVYVKNKGYLRSNAFIGLHDDAKNAWISDYFWSCHIYLVFGFILLFCGIYCFRVFFNINQKKDILYYSILCCLTVIYLSLFYTTEIPVFSFYQKKYEIFHKITMLFIPANIFLCFTLFLDDFLVRKPTWMGLLTRWLILIFPQLLYFFVPEKYCNGMISLIPVISFIFGIFYIAYIFISELNKGTKGSFKILICSLPVILCIFFDAFIHAGLNINYLPYISMWGWPLALISILFLISRKRITELKEKAENSLVAVKSSYSSSSEEEKIVIINSTPVLPYNQQYELNQVEEFENFQIAYCHNSSDSENSILYDFFAENNKLLGLSFFEFHDYESDCAHIKSLTKDVVTGFFTDGKILPLTKVMQNINSGLIAERNELNGTATGYLVRLFDSRFEYVNVGHSPAYFRNEKGSKCLAIKIDSDSYKQQSQSFIGQKEISSDYKGIGFAIKSGDAVIVYSSAFENARNLRGEVFGQDRIRQAFLQSPDLSAYEKLSYIMTMFQNFTRDVPVEQDVVVIILQKK